MERIAAVQEVAMVSSSGKTINVNHKYTDDRRNNP